MRKLAFRLSLVVAVVVLVGGVFSGCSLSTSEADLSYENIGRYRAYVTVDGSSKTISVGSSETWTIEWDGLDDKDVKVELRMFSGGSVLDSETVTLSNGDSRKRTVAIW